jgi:hypothetical protein
MRLAKLLGSAGLVVVAIVLLTLHSRVHDTEDLATGENARRLTELDARLDRAVLESHTGLTLDYDEVATTLREISRTLREMDRSVGQVSDPVLSARMTGAHAHFAERERLVETFESLSSVLRNSVAFFPGAAGQARRAAPAGEAGEPTRAALAALLIAVLQSGDGASAESVTEIEHRVLARWKPRSAGYGRGTARLARWCSGTRGSSWTMRPGSTRRSALSFRWRGRRTEASRPSCAIGASARYVAPTCTGPRSRSSAGHSSRPLP